MGVYKALTKPECANTDAENGARRKNKQRVLILSSRGVTHRLVIVVLLSWKGFTKTRLTATIALVRQRHLLNDLASMMPQARKDVKFDSKSSLNQLNELADLYNCNNVMFFEARKSADLYLWLSKVPNGPAVKFHVQNLHTMEELHFTGNCLKGSRPILSFDPAFEAEPHLRLIKELLTHALGVPEGQRKSKPFVDHVLSFSIVDGKIWFRNYQINEVDSAKAKKDVDVTEDQGEEDAGSIMHKHHRDTEVDLVEIGPRFVLTPIIIQEGSFGGPIIYENKQFVSPNQIRAQLRRDRASRHNAKAGKQLQLRAKKGELGIRTGAKVPRDELDIRELFS